VSDDDSVFVAKEPCPECGSRDNLARYSDGHAFCFGCSHWEPPTDGSGERPQQTERRQVSGLIDAGDFIALGKRQLSEEDCRKAGYSVSTFRGQPVQIAAIKDPMTGETIAQKVRLPNKDFLYLGETKDDPFYLQHLWKDGGKRVVITEGEVDAVTVLKIQQHKWPVVSITKGVKGAKKQIQQQLKWLDKFDEVVLMFDNDEEHTRPDGTKWYPGQDTAIDCASVFKPGKCKIARLPLKDASDMHTAGRDDEVVTAIWNAKTYRPDGVVTIAEVRDAVLRDPEQGFPWFSEELTKQTYGRRLGEISTFGAGTGVGKTDFLTEQMQFDMVQLSQPIGVFSLEQQPAETVKRLAGKQAGKRFHIPSSDENAWSKDELIASLDVMEAGGKLFMYDSFGATDWGIIQTTIRFLHHSEGVKLFYVDHLTGLAAAESDEKTGIERIMAEMAALVKELNIHIHLVSHLATPEGKPHEEGGRVMIRHFKGSRSIGFWSHSMFGMERDQQAESEVLRTITTFRILKHRPDGSKVGKCVYFGYDSEIGRLFETELPEEVNDNPFQGKAEGSNTDF
jgi:twinkle protein